TRCATCWCTWSTIAVSTATSSWSSWFDSRCHVQRRPELPGGGRATAHGHDEADTRSAPRPQERRVGHAGLPRPSPRPRVPAPWAVDLRGGRAGTAYAPGRMAVSSTSHQGRAKARLVGL